MNLSRRITMTKSATTTATKTWYRGFEIEAQDLNGDRVVGVGIYPQRNQAQRILTAMNRATAQTDFAKLVIRNLITDGARFKTYTDEPAKDLEKWTKDAELHEELIHLELEEGEQMEPIAQAPAEKKTRKSRKKSESSEPGEKILKEAEEMLEEQGVTSTAPELKIVEGGQVEEVQEEQEPAPQPCVDPDQEGFKGSNYDSTLTTTDVAKKIREQVKGLKKDGTIPKDTKISVTSKYFSGGSSISIYVKESPRLRFFNPEYFAFQSALKDGSKNLSSDRSPERHSEEGQKILDLLKGIAESYNYDKSDIQTDYFNVNFYLHVETEYELERNEQAIWEAEQGK
jgi:hypothetical protein